MESAFSIQQNSFPTQTRYYTSLPGNLVPPINLNDPQYLQCCTTAGCVYGIHWHKPLGAPTYTFSPSPYFTIYVYEPIKCPTLPPSSW